MKLNVNKEYLINLWKKSKPHLSYVYPILLTIITIVLIISWIRITRAIERTHVDSLFYNDTSVSRIMVEPVEAPTGLEYQITFMSFMGDSQFISRFREKDIEDMNNQIKSLKEKYK